MKLIIIVGVINLLLRAADYLTGDFTQLGIVEVDGPWAPIVWGAACLLAAVTITVGMALSRLKIAAFGALIASATYVMFSVQAIDESLFTPPIDDWRFASDYIARAVTWGVITGWLYMRDGVLAARRAAQEAARE